MQTEDINKKKILNFLSVSKFVFLFVNSVDKDFFWGFVFVDDDDELDELDDDEIEIVEFDRLRFFLDFSL